MTPRNGLVCGARLHPASTPSEARWFPRDAIPWRRIDFASIRRALRADLRALIGMSGL